MDIDLAQPMEELFPKFKKNINAAHLHLDEEILKLQPVVWLDITRGWVCRRR